MSCGAIYCVEEVVLAFEFVINYDGSFIERCILGVIFFADITVSVHASQ